MFGNAAMNVAEVVLAKVSFDAGNLGLGDARRRGRLGLALGSVARGPLARAVRVAGSTAARSR